LTPLPGPVNATGASGLQATRGRSDNSERKR
jgi:hypothetical protein